ncbi:hypothetical protein BDZ90DRAFT_230698 [Jaminaea rosea]|uniref:Uncharacterized protein n=1 Tax=Jaminaea rosea TaxID=1569628 RepID=A0A316UX18_9BASI|nr:hypothetical protein BDZ90DRAFT_230698 [Jaminaea rosea]PWN29857.1 hypothetical protein BDZ90DRAFT_230698 [Jaminaea rosea]
MRSGLALVSALLLAGCISASPLPNTPLRKREEIDPDSFLQFLIAAKCGTQAIDFSGGSDGCSRLIYNGKCCQSGIVVDGQCFTENPDFQDAVIAGRSSAAQYAYIDYSHGHAVQVSGDFSTPDSDALEITDPMKSYPQDSPSLCQDFASSSSAAAAAAAASTDAAEIKSETAMGASTTASPTSTAAPTLTSSFSPSSSATSTSAGAAGVVSSAGSSSSSGGSNGAAGLKASLGSVFLAVAAGAVFL